MADLKGKRPKDPGANDANNAMCAFALDDLGVDVALLMTIKAEGTSADVGAGRSASALALRTALMRADGVPLSFFQILPAQLREIANDLEKQLAGHKGLISMSKIPTGGAPS